eukprot:498097_1
MLLKNLGDGLANGSRGIVTDFDGRYPVVQFANGTIRTIKLAKWEMHELEKLVACRVQIPLRLAWAISIHKSQGMSIDLLEVNLSSAFAAGQAYVALSRATSAHTLRVCSFAPSRVIADPRAIEFHEACAKFGDGKLSAIDVRLGMSPVWDPSRNDTGMVIRSRRRSARLAAKSSSSAPRKPSAFSLLPRAPLQRFPVRTSAPHKRLPPAVDAFMAPISETQRVKEQLISNKRPRKNPRRRSGVSYMEDFARKLRQKRMSGETQNASSTAEAARQTVSSTAQPEKQNASSTAEAARQTASPTAQTKRRNVSPTKRQVARQSILDLDISCDSSFDSESELSSSSSDSMDEVAEMFGHHGKQRDQRNSARTTMISNTQSKSANRKHVSAESAGVSTLPTGVSTTSSQPLEKPLKSIVSGGRRLGVRIHRGKLNSSQSKNENVSTGRSSGREILESVSSSVKVGQGPSLSRNRSERLLNRQQRLRLSRYLEEQTVSTPQNPEVPGRGLGKAEASSKSIPVNAEGGQGLPPKPLRSSIRGSRRLGVRVHRGKPKISQSSSQVNGSGERPIRSSSMTNTKNTAKPSDGPLERLKKSLDYRVVSQKSRKPLNFAEPTEKLTIPCSGDSPLRRSVSSHSALNLQSQSSSDLPHSSQSMYISPRLSSPTLTEAPIMSSSGLSQPTQHQKFVEPQEKPTIPYPGDSLLRHSGSSHSALNLHEYNSSDVPHSSHSMYISPRLSSPTLTEAPTVLSLTIAEAPTVQSPILTEASIVPAYGLSQPTQHHKFPSETQSQVVSDIYVSHKEILSPDASKQCI